MVESLETAQHFIVVTQIHFCAMYAIVLYDWIISFHREYVFIWKTRWTVVKGAYLFCRYWVIAVIPYVLYAFVLEHSLEECEKVFRIPAALCMWNQVSSEVILLIRTYAFFNKNKFVLFCLLAGLLGVATYQLYVVNEKMFLLPFLTPPYTHGPCLPVSGPHSAHLLGFFLAPLAFDTIVTFLCLGKALAIIREHGGANNRLIHTFIREGLFYYLLISFANLVNGIFYLQHRQAISAINIPLSVMLGPVLACRLVLDLKERGSETIAESVGTAAFVTKSITQHSPFTPPGRTDKGGSNYRRRELNTFTSNVMLTTLGTIPPDPDSLIRSMRSADDLQFAPDIASVSTAIGGEPLQDVESQQEGTPAPTYRSLEIKGEHSRRSYEDIGLPTVNPRSS